MTLYEFNQYPAEEKAKVVGAIGVCIVTYADTTTSFKLFSVADFFVEVAFHTTTKEIVAVQGVRNIGEIAPYHNKVAA